MREIKLRAWDKKQKQMSGVFTLVDLTQYEHTFERMFRHLARFKDLIWLEYTGLKDKNGKEIYEGDLFWWDWHSEPILRVVEFYNGGFVARDAIDHIIPMEHLGNFLLKTQVEVIGNIYEHSYLLDKKTEK